MNSKILIIVFWTCLVSIKSFACDCKIYSNLKVIQKKEYSQSTYIFIGEIIKIDSKKHTFEIRVIESFKGALERKVYKGIYNYQCGPIIDMIGNWLIYANSKAGNLIQIRTCGITRSFKNPNSNIWATRLPNPPTINQTKFKNKNLQSKFELRAKFDLENEIAELRKKGKQQGYTLHTVKFN